MTKVKTPDLLASAHTLSAIGECVTKFYGGQPMQLVPNERREWDVVRCSDGKIIFGCRVVCKRGRFRFERMAQ